MATPPGFGVRVANRPSPFRNFGSEDGARSLVAPPHLFLREKQRSARQIDPQRPARRMQMGQGKERTAHLLRHRKEKGQFSDRLWVSCEHRNAIAHGGFARKLLHQFVRGIAFRDQ